MMMFAHDTVICNDRREEDSLETVAQTPPQQSSNEVEDLSPPESPSTVEDSGGDMIGDSNTAHSGPEPHHLQPLAQQEALRRLC